jgi:oxygen-independent coproporphyrinogen-3 oxidase
VLEEIREFFARQNFEDEIDTVYFGGGTPSVVPAEHIEGVLNTCLELASRVQHCEITIEANPGSVTPAKAVRYASCGVNRISLGAQSFNDHELAAIGRDHTGVQVDESLELFRRSGISNLSLDLLLGLPDQTAKQWNANLERATHLSPTHISVYMLDLDERSPLFHSIAKGRHFLPEDDLISDLYLQTIDFLARKGYEQYEISNFALAGYQSRHNLKYWRRDPVLGFGVGSHSYDGHSRYANSPKLHAYLEAVEAGRSPIQWRQPVSLAQGLEEMLFLGLRLNRGLDWREIRRENAESAKLAGYESSLHNLAEQGLLEWNNSSVRLTRRGMLLSNEVFCEFI